MGAARVSEGDAFTGREARLDEFCARVRLTFTQSMVLGVALEMRPGATPVVIARSAAGLPRDTAHAFETLFAAAAASSARVRIASLGRVAKLARGVGLGPPAVRALAGAFYVTAACRATGVLWFVAIVPRRPGPIPRHRRLALYHVSAALQSTIGARTTARPGVPGTPRDGLQGAAIRAERTASMAMDESRAFAELRKGGWSVAESFVTASRLVMVIRLGGQASSSVGLSRRESEVVALVARGCANKFVALELGLAEQTVATHLARARAKLGVSSRLDLIRVLAAGVGEHRVRDRGPRSSVPR